MISIELFKSPAGFPAGLFVFSVARQSFDNPGNASNVDSEILPTMIFRILFGIGLLAVISPSRANIVITEVMSDSGHPANSTANDDWFELTNTGAISVSLVGWSWNDDHIVAGAAGFGSITSIGPGESVIITGEAASAGTEAAAWRADWGIGSNVQVATLTNSMPGLGKTGDAIYIYDNSSTLVTSKTFGASTTGHSFAWDTAGNFLGTSVVGQYGAFSAQSNGSTSVPPTASALDVGSPGVAAVPEPSTIVLATLGFGALLYGVQRRRFVR